MNIKVTYKHLDSTPSLNEITRTKSEKLSKYFDGKMNLYWNFSVEKQAHVAHCRLTGNHMDYFAEASTDSIYSAIDEVVFALEKQVRKNKEQLKNHHYKKINVA